MSEQGKLNFSPDLLLGSFPSGGEGADFSMLEGFGQRMEAILQFFPSTS